MIYLIGSGAKFKGIETLVLNEIKFSEISVNLADFSALVITSKNAVEAMRFNRISPNKNLKIFAIGEASARAAREFGFCEIYVSQNAHGDAFAREISGVLAGKKTLFLRAGKTASSVAEILRDAGVDLTQIVAYENVYKPDTNLLKPPKGSVLIFTAPSAVRNFARNFSWQTSNTERYKCVAIGETTAKELVKFCEPVVCAEQSVNACVSLAKTLI